MPCVLAFSDIEGGNTCIIVQIGNGLKMMCIIVAVFFSVMCMDLLLFIASLSVSVTTIIRSLTSSLSSKTFLAFGSSTV